MLRVGQAPAVITSSALILAAIAGSGCPSPPTCAGRGGTGGGAGQISLPIALTGKPLNVGVELTPSFSSCASTVKATRVDVGVLGPDNRPVMATATPPQNGSGGQDLSGAITTTVTFTPKQPGPYHLNVRFEPSLGLVQQDMLVAADKTQIAPVVVGLPVSPKVSCQQIDFDGDTLLCLDTSTTPSWLRTIRSAQVVASVEANVFAYSQGLVWLQSPADSFIYLYSLDAGGQLTQLDDLNISSSRLPQLFPHGDRLLMTADDTFLELHHLDGGGFTGPSLPTPVELPNGAQWVPDVGVVIGSGSSGGGVCSFALSGELVGDGGCEHPMAQIAGFDDDGLWWTEPSAATGGMLALFVAGFRPGQPGLATGSLLVPQGGQLGFGSQSTPVFVVNAGSNELYLPRFDGKDIFLERYPFSQQAIHADSKRLWFQGGDTITWYPR